MNKKRLITGAVCLFGILGVSTTTWLIKTSKNSSRSLSDDALLALIKNDQSAFEDIIQSGLNLQDTLPVIDGKNYTVAEGMSYFERVSFMKYLHSQKRSYVSQNAGKEFDVVSLAVEKNNEELLKQIALEKPNFKLTYNSKGWTLMHLASSLCAHKVIATLHKEGNLMWNQKAKDGSTALTLAAQSDCLPILSYWKEHKADFNAKDGRGLSALSILKKKKDAALMAFAASFEPERKSAAVKAEPNFYRKRKIPKDQIVDHSALIEPDDRPIEAIETAEISEFAD